MKKNAEIYLKEKDKKRDENEKKININKKMKRLKGKKNSQVSKITVNDVLKNIRIQIQT